jgi:hypothetical protein
MFVKFSLSTSKSLDDVKINCTQEQMDEFRSNVESTSAQTTINYSNSFIGDSNTNSINIYDAIFLNTKRDSYGEDKKIYFEQPNDQHLCYPIKNLIYLSSNDMFLISDIDVDFKYTIDNKNYEYKDS